MGEFVLAHHTQFVLVGYLFVMFYIVVGNVETVVKGVLADFQQGGGIVVLVFAGTKTAT